MSRFNIGHKSWVIVCDGAKALFLRNDGDAGLVNLTVVEHQSQPDEATRDLGSDRPGRVHQSHGASRSAMEETDWHEQAEAEFLKDVAKKVEKLVESREIKAMILVAPPKALGILRAEFASLPEGIIRAEIDKDLVKLTVSEIEKHLAALK
ncbi:baeRF12 domain-containing protein [Rhizobium arsenicireducens]